MNKQSFQNNKIKRGDKNKLPFKYAIDYDDKIHCNHENKVCKSTSLFIEYIFKDLGFLSIYSVLNTTPQKIIKLIKFRTFLETNI